MFPIHCAVIGGSLELVKWMVDGHLCPISANADPKTNQPLSVQTSANRTLMDLAMTGKPKYDILSFLLQKGLSISDAKHPELASRCLENLLKSGYSSGALSSVPIGNLVEVESQSDLLTVEDACHICFERQMDVVFTPCVSKLLQEWCYDHEDSRSTHTARRTFSLPTGAPTMLLRLCRTSERLSRLQDSVLVLASLPPLRVPRSCDCSRHMVHFSFDIIL